jgi:AcrR family transcriptional regulator
VGARDDEPSPPQAAAVGAGQRHAQGDAAPRRRGRRPGRADTRAELLAAARVEFAERGYDGATVRVIAERAGVDAAMVNHWFGGKDSLFISALDLPMDPTSILAEVVPGDPDHLAERIIARFLELWDGTGGAPLSALLQSVATHDAAARLLREFVERVLVARVVSTVAPDRPALRAGLCGSQILGLAVVRYVLKVEPLASADHATVIAAVAPNLQRYLTGPLP